MTREERLRRLAALEAKLKPTRPPRCFVRVVDGDTGEPDGWLGKGPPASGFIAGDLVLDVTFVEAPVRGGDHRSDDGGAPR